VLLCGLLAFSGCHRHRPEQPAVSDVPDTAIVRPDTVRVSEEPPAPAFYVPPVRQWLSVRMSGAVKMPGMGSLDVNLFAVVLRDSLIYLHISKFGIELGRALCRPGKILLLVHPELAYWEGDYATFRKKSGVPLEFGVLQDVLLLTSRDARTVVDTDGYLIRMDWPDRDGGCYLQAAYGTYADIASGSQVKYPQDIRLSMPKSGGNLRMTVKSVKVDEPGPVTVRVPEKYRPLQW
jgi:hypothetical protein